MGLILDTSVLVAAERRRQRVEDILVQIRERFSELETGISALTIAELTHGIERAKLDAQRQRRQTFVSDLKTAIPIYPITTEIAERAGTISGRQAERGIAIPFEDLLIGATALHLGFDVLTDNLRHFELIPGLVFQKL